MKPHSRPSWTALIALTFLLAGAPDTRAQESLNRFDAAQVVLGSTDPQFQRLIDLDGDARLDALGMRGGSSTTELRLYLNQGNGSFSGIWSHTINWPANEASNQAALDVGDLDGDGRRDDFAIAVGNRLFRFQGSGTSASVSSVLPLPGVARDLRCFDLDLDGRDDLVILCDGRLSIILDPFAPGVLPTTINHAPSAATATDLILIRLANGTTSLIAAGVQVIFTPGSGLSAAPSLYPPGSPLTFGTGASGDIDGDGDEDGVLVQFSRHFLITQGPGSTLSISGPEDSGPISALIDLDGDGDLDGVHAGGGEVSGTGGLVPNHFEGVFVFHRNDGAGGFEAPRVVRSLGAQRLAGASDLDGDGDLDFLAGRTIFFGRSTSVFERPYSDRSSPSIGQSFLSGNGDLDDDGDLDVGLGATEFYRNDGRGNLRLSTPNWLGPAPSASSFEGFAVADYNLDGSADVVVKAGSAAYLAYNLGGGALAWYPGSVATGSAAVAFGAPQVLQDLDNDGDIDCVGNFFSSFTTTVASAMNSGLNTFTAGSSIANERVVAAADFDNDGLVDLVTQSAGIGVLVAPLRWARHFPQGTFSGFNPIHPTVPVIAPPHVSDLDGDGDADVVALINGVGHVLFTNDGTGSFSQTVLVSIPSLPLSKAGYVLTDVNGDGLQDLIAAPAPDAHAGAVTLLGTGSGFVLDSVVHAFIPTLASDLDGDGDDDVIDQDYGTLQRSVRFDGTNAGLRRQFGSGTPGSAGLVPTLGASGPFREGEFVTLRLRNALGGATAFFVFGGVPLTQVNYPLLGHTSYFDPLASTSLIWPALPLGGFPGVQGSGVFDLSFYIPVGLSGLGFQHQAYVLDPQGPSGASATQGLEIRYGL